MELFKRLRKSLKSSWQNYKLKSMDYEYYEIIAAELFGIEPSDIFKKSRISSCRVARQFCMKYRKEHLKLSFDISAKRYGLDHATCISACRRIDNYVSTNDIYGEKYLDFLEKCKVKRQQVEMMLQQEKKQLLRNIESMGWYDYVHTVVDPMTTLAELVYRNDNEDMIRDHIRVVEEKLDELKYLYRLEYEPQNV